MSTFVPEGGIRCERCHEIFHKYVFITDVIDIDKDDDIAKGALSGFVNRVVCSFCDTEFTYETPLMLFSHNAKCISLTNDSNFLPVNVRNLPLALNFAQSSDWNLRLCNFAMSASEKMRIFKDGLNDAVIEILKLKSFEDYRNMAFEYEYIVYEGICEDKLKFVKRDDCENLISNYELPFETYLSICKDNIIIPTGNWQTIDRDWAIKFLEDTK